jgi:hypothetical protein
MIAPALLLENLPATESFTRSHELVRGRGWPVFGLLILLFVINVLAGGVIVGLASGASGGFFATWIGSALANTLVTPFIAIATTVVYFRLAANGPSRELVGETF